MVDSTKDRKEAVAMLGYSVTKKSKEACIGLIAKWIQGGAKRKYFVCANPNTLEIAMTDRILEAALKGADLITPDGFGVIIASKILGDKLSDRVTGSDIFLGLSERLKAEGNYSYFFLGSTTDTLDKIRKRMSRDFPNISVAGTFSPPFKSKFSEEDSRVMVEAINSAKPDVLWVGMTAPKQEKWIYENKDKLDVKFIGAIGAVFDFFSGTFSRSHPWFQETGLEWLPRLLKQPRRLWKRTIINAPMFLIRILGQRFMGRH